MNLSAYMPKNSFVQLCSLSEFRDLEQNNRQSTTVDGELLDYVHLELRVHPPNVDFNNSLFPDRTVITIDSANRPGTLVEVVQWLTEMGLNVRKARISSDGGWFVDEFHTDRISDKLKENEIRRVLGSDAVPHAAPSGPIQEETVFELAGPDRSGLLADVVSLLKANGCDVQSAAVWTSHGRAAFVVSVLERLPHAEAAGESWAAAAAAHQAVASTSAPGPGALLPRVGGVPTNSMNASADVEGTHRGGTTLMTATSAGGGGGTGHAVHDPAKLQRVKELLSRIMTGPRSLSSSQSGPVDDSVYVHCSTVRGGLIHFERRLHRLLLLREEADWEESDLAAEYEVMVGNGQGELPAWHRLSPPPLSPGPTLSASTAPTDSIDRAISSMLPSGGLANWSYDPLPSTSLYAPTSPYRPHRLSISSAPLSGVPETSANGQSHGLVLPASTATHLQLPSPLPGQLVPGGVGSGSRGKAGNGLPPTPPGTWHPSSSTMLVSPKFSKPEVSIRHNSRLKYWLVEIRCKDRKKLFFDTVCTLADLDYDIFHGSVDVEGDLAHQVYYIRRCTGDSSWNRPEAAKLCYMLEAAIQRRFPKGIKIRIQSWQQYDLAALTTAWHEAGLLITRAKVRPSMGHGAGPGRAVSNTFYLLDSRTGAAPDPQVVQHACVTQGGVAMTPQILTPSPGTQGLANGGSITGPTAPHTLSPPGAAGVAAMIAAAQHGYAGAAGRMAAAAGMGAGMGAGTRASVGAGVAVDLARQKAQGAAFGFALLHRTHVGSPTSATSSM